MMTIPAGHGNEISANDSLFILFTIFEKYCQGKNLMSVISYGGIMT